jgi:hypothetical protein
MRQLNRRGNSQLLAPTQAEVEHWKRAIQLSSVKTQTLHYVKRDANNGRFLDVKTSDTTPFKGVRREKK